MKTACAGGLGSIMVPFRASAQTQSSASTGVSEDMTVPKRPFGKIGVEVPILALGGVLNIADQLVFRQAYKMGVRYWDTANGYGWGKNEKAIGKYFARFPDDRKNIFLVTKAGTSNPQKLTENLVKKGYTAEQAKLRVVWENPDIASICSAMPNMTILQANVAAALNEQHLSEADRQCLEQYAQQTAPGYCAGCANICESAVHLDVPVSDILRYSMYYHSYGDRDTAVRLFNALPEDVKSNIHKADYSRAEKHCPQRIEIGKVLKNTVHDLS